MTEWLTHIFPGSWRNCFRGWFRTPILTELASCSPAESASLEWVSSPSQAGKFQLFLLWWFLHSFPPWCLQRLCLWTRSLSQSFRRRRGVAEDEAVGWHHRLSGHEFKQTPRDGEGLSCYRPWVCKELDRNERLNKEAEKSIEVAEG